MLITWNASNLTLLRERGFRGKASQLGPLLQLFQMAGHLCLLPPRPLRLSDPNDGNQMDQRVSPPFNIASVSMGKFLPAVIVSLNYDLNLAHSEVRILKCAYVGMYPPQSASPIGIPHTFFDGGEHGIFGSCTFLLAVNKNAPLPLMRQL